MSHTEPSPSTFLIQRPIDAVGGPFFGYIGATAATAAATDTVLSAGNMFGAIVLGVFVLKAELDDRRSDRSPTRFTAFFAWAFYGLFVTAGPFLITGKPVGAMFAALGFVVAVLWLAADGTETAQRKAWLVLSAIYGILCSLVALEKLPIALLGFALAALISLDFLISLTRRYAQ